ncbi:hypothetical protein [uncultured Cedecea sp.]|uniref:hypothetical protein n=1 Tax=uncultured Cedecea sp. TaxID=988762 RepID=UPI002633AA55|nr:hypothetical protein [uncultured Cedecea sp.]
MSLPLTTETSSSPYSYYKDRQDSKVTLNNDSLSTSVTTTQKIVTTIENPVITTMKPVMVPTYSLNSVYMTAKLTTTAFNYYRADTEITDSSYDRGRNIYFEKIKSKNGYPFGEKFYNQITTFCLSKMRSLIEDAFIKDSLEAQRQALGTVIDEIKDIERTLALQAESFSNKKPSSEYNLYEKMTLEDYFYSKRLMKSKLSACHLAAEYIMNKKAFCFFVIEANADDNEYKNEIIEQRENNIFDFFSEE